MTKTTEISAESLAIRERSARKAADEARAAVAEETDTVSRLQAAASSGERVDPAEFQDANAALELAKLRAAQLDREASQVATEATTARQAQRVADLASHAAADSRLDEERLRKLRDAAAEAADAYRLGLWDYSAAFEELTDTAREIGLPTLCPGEDGDGLITSSSYSTGGPQQPTGPIARLRANGVAVRAADAYTAWGRFAAELAAKK